MIILDTNVLSELMKPAPTGRVVDWMSIATPNVADFDACGVTLMNPWNP